MNVPALQVENLSVRFGAKRVLEVENLSAPRKAITALMGPSGCGKTSFLMCINRLCDHASGCLVSGKVRVDGEDVLAPGADLLRLRRKVGMIFQRPMPFPLSIRRNLELPLRERGIRSRSTLADTIEAVLRDVGLWEEVRDRLDSPALALSGGQRQRLCIARAIALKPELLLMDEPCSALDPISSGVVEDLILGLRGRYTVIIVTHNLAQARRIADHCGLFWVRNGAGHLVEFGAARQVFEAPRDEVTAAYVRGLRG